MNENKPDRRTTYSLQRAIAISVISFLATCGGLLSAPTDGVDGPTGFDFIKEDAKDILHDLFKLSEEVKKEIEKHLP